MPNVTTPGLEAPYMGLLGRSTPPIGKPGPDVGLGGGSGRDTQYGFLGWARQGPEHGA